MGKKREEKLQEKKVEAKEQFEKSEVSEPAGEAGEESEKSEEEEQPAQLGILKERLSETEKQNKELEERLIRLAAEFDNYKKRVAKEQNQLVKNANENLISKLLESLDNFSRALDSAKNSADIKSLQSGLELIYSQLMDILTKEGLEEIRAVGERFDPYLHEAVLQIESDQPEGTIVDEISKGYKLNGKVIRHSKVVVAKHKNGSLKASGSAQIESEDKTDTE
ncbi:MAG TPA: nucleotide exchange factor GrpE [candidate division Zixibacteria bacterium]|nr:nucleotide exchange factor GrpE [candidate division Zixibacteria bacterium]